MADQFLEELRRAQAAHAGHELAAQVLLDVRQGIDAFLADVGAVRGQREVDRLRRDAELVVKVVERRAVGIEDDAFEGTHAQVFQRDGVLVAHRLQMAGHDAGHGLQFGFRSEGAQPLDFLGQHHIVVRDVRHHEGTHLALVALPHRARAAHRQGRQQVQHAVLLLDEDLAEAHRLDREQVE